MGDSVLHEGSSAGVQALIALLRRMARACGVGPDSLEDMVQEGLLEVLRRLPEWTGANPLPVSEAWLYCVVQSKVRDAQRRATAHRAGDLDMAIAAGQEPMAPGHARRWPGSSRSSGICCTPPWSSCKGRSAP